MPEWTRVNPVNPERAAGLLFHRKSAGHRGCFRCKHCDVPLASSNFACAGTSFYCNVHFKQLFAREGNYNFAVDSARKSSIDAEINDEEPTVPEESNLAAFEPGDVPFTESAPASASSFEKEHGDAVEPSCYMYGDLVIPFELEDGWQRVCEVQTHFHAPDS